MNRILRDEFLSWPRFSCTVRNGSMVLPRWMGGTFQTHHAQYGWSISNPSYTVWMEHFKPIIHSMGGAFQTHHTLYGWSIPNPSHTVWVEHFKPITHSMGGTFQTHHTQCGWSIPNPSHTIRLDSVISRRYWLSIVRSGIHTSQALVEQGNPGNVDWQASSIRDKRSSFNHLSGTSRHLTENKA